MKRLQARWGLNSWVQVVLVLLVFAATGSTSLWLSKPVLIAIGLYDMEPKWLAFILRLIIIFPVYNVLLLMFGFLLGQFQFFWAFEKRMFGRMLGRKPGRGGQS